MVLNRVYRNLMPLLVVVILMTFCGNAYSQNASVAYVDYVDTRVSLNEVNDELDGAELVLLQYRIIRDNLIGKLGEWKSDSRTNVNNSLKAGITRNPVDAVAALLTQFGATMTGVELIAQLDSINIQMVSLHTQIAMETTSSCEMKQAITLSMIGISKHTKL